MASVRTTLHVERPELLDQSMKDVLSLPDVSDVYEGAHMFQGTSHLCLPWLLTCLCWTQHQTLDAALQEALIML